MSLDISGGNVLALFIIGLLIVIIFGVIGIMMFKNGESIVGIVCTLMAIVGLVLMIFSCVIVVNPGEVAVPVTLGSVDNVPRQAGIHVVSPITDLIIFNVKTQEDTQSSTVLTAEGLDVTIDMTALYHLDPAKVSEIYKTVGSNYKDILIDPQIRSTVRDVIATYDAKNIYSADRSNISNKIHDGLKPAFDHRGIVLENVLLRSAVLPQKVKDSIEAKQQMEQQIQQKSFEVQKEQKEADRKRAEAQGIADANRIISNSLSSHYLQWYWIQQLNGNEVFYIPTGSDGFPVNLVKNLEQVTPNAK